MDEITHFQIDPAGSRDISHSGSAGNENVLHPILQQQARRQLLCVCLFLFLVCFIPCLSQNVQAAVVTINSTLSVTSTSHNGATPTTVFISDQIGYTFFISSTNTCVYSKTTNGGASWSSTVTVDSQTDCLGVGIWYDQWTPGDSTGTYIHIVTFDSGSDDLWYARLNTSNDTLTTPVNASGAGQGGAFASGTNLASITKGTDGTLYIGILGSDSFVLESTDGTAWSEAGTGATIFGTTADFLILMPLSGGNIMAIRWLIAADDIQSRVWDGSSWGAGWTTVDANAADNTTYDGAFGATVDKSTGNIYLAYAADIVTLGANDDIRTAVYSGGAWSAKTDVLTNDTKGITGAKIARDENNGNIYALYSARTGSSTATTGNVYYKKSTDGMTSWGAETGPVNTSSDDIYGARVNMMSTERMYVTWYGATPDDLFGDTIADISPPGPGPEPIKEKLTIESTSPNDAATSVAVNASVSATFSMLINGSTLTTDSFMVSKDGEELTGSVTSNAKTATFTPSANLDYNTTYTARVTTKAQAANYAGTTLDNDYTWSFTTTEDADPPTVSSTSPANGAASVAINSAITATFSEAMQSSTINTNTFTVSDGSNNISGTVSYNDTTATFTPSVSLSNSTTYTARITTEVRDLGGNTMASDYTWSFTTVDTTLPTVRSTSPANGATGVAINSVITATFSEAMLSSTMNTNTFTVSDGNDVISGTVSYSDKTATFTPSNSLSDSTTYTARITTGAMDLAGNALASEYTWSFTTVDTTTPTVSSTTPADGEDRVAISSAITATFSEAMQSSTINTNTFTVSDSSGAISGTVSYSGTTATFTPSRNLSDSTTYTAKITIRVKDLAGNALASDYTWSFTTGDFIAPTVSSTSPVNGATGVAINSAITATFSEEMQSSTVNKNTFTVSNGKRNISGTVSYSDKTATFTPSGVLSDSTTYTVKITTGVTDLSGNALASDYTWSFTTVDTTTPTVSSTSPADGETGVAINSTITVTFSEEVQSSTINTNTFTVSDGSSNISGTVSYTDMTAIFTTAGNLSHSATYTVTISTGVRDLAENALASDYTWSFTTTDDADPPTVSSTSPPNGGAGVAINRTITATFSEEMQSSSLDTSTFTVSDGNGNISGSVSYGDTTATFTPSGNLFSYTAYTARITTGVKDFGGNAMESLYTWSFMTTGDVDFTAPTVSSTSPANGAAGVDVSSTITATFSEEMDASTITTDTFTVNDGSSYISGTVSYSDMTAAFTPSGNLPAYTTITARITAGVRDLVGNALTSDYAWSFTTTGDFTVPAVKSTSPANGAAGVDVGSIITATFSEEMDASTITADTFTVNDGSGNLSGTVSYGDKKATFTPSDNLAYSTTYTAVISTGVMDSAENALSAPYTWSFTTESAPVATPTTTTIATATPTPTPVVTGAIEVWVTDAVTGESINAAAVTLDTGQSTTIAAECDQDGFCPFRDLAAGNYTVTASASGYASETQSAIVTGDGTTVVTFALSAVPIQTPTPVQTPAPILCDAEKIEASPEEIKLQKKEKATVLISIICGDGVTPVIGETVTVNARTSKKRVRVSPSIAVTDDNGQAVFKIVAKNTTGNARIQFKTSNSREVVKVKVTN